MLFTIGHSNHPIEKFIELLQQHAIAAVYATKQRQLSYADLLKLKRWNSPTIYNGWEAITSYDRRTHFNLEETRDYMPRMGPMIGYASAFIQKTS